MKVMGDGLTGRDVVHGGLHLPLGARLCHQVLGAHMLEICPSIAADQPEGGDPSAYRSAGRRGAPVRLVFDRGAAVPALSGKPRSSRSAPGSGLLVNEVGVGATGPGAAEIAGRPRGVGMQARLQDGLRSLDSGRRRASHGVQLQRNPGDA